MRSAYPPPVVVGGLLTLSPALIPYPEKPAPIEALPFKFARGGRPGLLQGIGGPVTLFV